MYTLPYRSFAGFSIFLSRFHRVNLKSIPQAGCPAYRVKKAAGGPPVKGKPLGMMAGYDDPLHFKAKMRKNPRNPPGIPDRPMIAGAFFQEIPGGLSAGDA
jgi:hypothetical protein